jgi:lipid-binding SYLF domain-containing protein
MAIGMAALAVTAAYADEADRVRKSIEILSELTQASDRAIPKHVLERAEAVVVIPSFMKGGFIFGAEHGKGILSVRDRASNTWSDPAFVEMTGGTFGAQIGLESVDLVLLVMNRGAIEHLLQDTFTLGAGASVAAGPVGRSARAGTDYRLDAQILAYSRAKGLFAGATLDGTALRADRGSNEDFYGQRMGSRAIVLEHQARTSENPALVAQWRAAIARETGARPVPTTGY